MEEINLNLNLDTISETMEDFNLPSPERIALLERLQAAIGGAPPHFWAACQICDLNALKRLVECGREYPGILRGFAQQTYTMAHYWGPSPPRAPSQPSTPKIPTPNKSTSSILNKLPSTPPAKRQKTSDSPVILRNQQVRGLAKQRDKSNCVLTGDASVEVAHIYPYHSIKHKEEDIFGQRHMFWDQLGNFWSKEKVTAWLAKLFPADQGGICEIGIERVYNLITLSRTAHDMWSRGAFALKPVLESDDKMTLEVQFFWQEKQKDAQQTMSLLTTPSSTKGLNQNVGAFEGGIASWLHRKDGTRIQSGDYFKLQTDDPETKPLPSFKLLEMQWFLQRIQGMAGAADVDWPSLSEPGSDLDDTICEGDYLDGKICGGGYLDDGICGEASDIPDLELDVVGDPSFLSPESLSSPTKPSLIKLARNDFPMHPKYYIEEARERAEDSRDMAM